MSRDEAREHIRAAQEAEIAGNREGAVRHLERAALAYVRVGLHARAAQMYRNCVRLAPERGDLKESLEKAEQWAAKGNAANAEPPPIVSAEGFDALAIPRGPQRMLQGLEAWCSFCCRPTREVGELVAGPAGAFICAECVRTSASMLGAPADGAPAQPQTQTELAAVAPRSMAAKPMGWLGPAPVLEAARAALSGGGPSVVVVGPEGSGKSALLAALAAEFPDAVRADFAGAELAPAQGAALLEHLDLADAAARRRLAENGFVATWRAEVEAEPLRVELAGEVVELPVARGFALPSELDGAVLVLPPPDAGLLQKLLERDVAERDGPILAPAMQAALVARALGSGRGAKGLLAELGLLRSLPPGASLSPVAAKPKRARRKKS